MSIKIETKKSVDGYGGQRRKIIKITGCLEDKDLPGLYRKGEHFAQMFENVILFKKGEVRNIEGEMFESSFQESLEELKLCAAALHEAKTTLKHFRDAWKGEETFTI